jgi:hypothetical protein
MKVFAEDRTTGARRKATSPCTLNPGTKNAAKEKQIPLTTSEKAPKVKKLIGNDRVDRTGLTEPLIAPITPPAIKAAGKLAISTPFGKIISTISKLKAVANAFRNVAII